MRDRKYQSGEIDLVAAIASEFQKCGLPEYQECTEKLLEKGRLLILLDGLDEVPSDRLSLMTTQIRDLLDRYSDNRFVTSCRIAAYRNFDNFRRFTNVAIADFDDGQIKTFIDKWFESHSQPEWGQQCWEKLDSGEHQATKELTRTPLLLTLICILFKRRGEFPNKRATVYNDALWTMLSEWDASKEIVRSSPYQGMDTKCKEIMLAEIAYDNFIVDNLFFQQGEITQQIESMLGEMLPEEKFIDGRAVLRAIEEQHGVLIGRSDDIYSFSHLTLQEFLTAKHIVDNSLDIQELVADHLCDRRWREVFFILAGLRRADNLLLAMEQTIKFLINTPKLQNLLAWAENATNSSIENTQLVRNRAIVLANACANINVFCIPIFFNTGSINMATIVAIFLYLNCDTIDPIDFNTISPLDFDTTNFIPMFEGMTDYVDAIDITKAIDKIINYAQLSEKNQIYQNLNHSKLIATLEKLKQQIPDDEEEKEVRRAFSERIYQTLLTAFNLNREMFDLSKSELEALNNYLYANLILIKCKDAAIRKSAPTWKRIKSQMLSPTNN